MDLSDDDLSQGDDDSQDDLDPEPNVGATQSGSTATQSGSKNDMNNVLDSFYSDLVSMNAEHLNIQIWYVYSNHLNTALVLCLNGPKLSG